jgi:dTDP-4-dehydrorhamnose reductase
MGYLGRIMAVILGTTGMLGSMVKRIIPDATELNRPQFNAENLDKIAFTPGERVVNCIGVIKPHCHNVQSAIKVNALFPHYLTTLHYASIVTAILKTHIPLPTLQHLVPADSVTKDELLAIIADEFNLNIRIKKVEASQAVDRTLTTNNPDLNKRLWRIAGYSKPPTVKRMIKELAEYIK